MTAPRDSRRDAFPLGAEQYAGDLVGTPWRACGRDAHGRDCLGIVLAWYEACGVVLPDPASLDAVEVLSSSLAERFVRVESPAFGDVARWGGFSSRRPHLGIVLSGGRLLHTTAATGAVIAGTVPAGALFYRLL